MSDEDQQELTEMWLVPDDPAEVDKIYAAMTQCQTLHPDPNDSFSDDDEGTEETNLISFQLLIHFYQFTH